MVGMDTKEVLYSNIIKVNVTDVTNHGTGQVTVAGMEEWYVDSDKRP